MSKLPPQPGEAPIGDIAARLRQIQKVRNWTVQQMADAVGMPKRSLENYMRLNDAQKPGIEAAARLSSALGVSLDWLVMDTRKYEQAQEEFVKVAARFAAVSFAREITNHHLLGEEVLSERTILGMTPEECGALVGNAAVTFARIMLENGGNQTAVELLEKAMDAELSALR
ncbi:MAG: helix-turn-helix domain-containing protein [Mangrovicoccus sp.]